MMARLRTPGPRHPHVDVVYPFDHLPKSLLSQPGNHQQKCSAAYNRAGIEGGFVSRGPHKPRSLPVKSSRVSDGRSFQRIGVTCGKLSHVPARFRSTPGFRQTDFESEGQRHAQDCIDHSAFAMICLPSPSGIRTSSIAPPASWLRIHIKAAHANVFGAGYTVASLPSKNMSTIKRARS